MAGAFRETGRSFHLVPEMDNTAPRATTWGLNNVQFVRLDAQQWTNWLERYRAGEEPELLTKELLEPHWVTPDLNP